MAIAKTRKKKHYTVEEANQMLPLLRAILRDVPARPISWRNVMSGSAGFRASTRTTASIVRMPNRCSARSRKTSAAVISTA